MLLRSSSKKKVTSSTKTLSVKASSSKQQRAKTNQEPLDLETFLIELNNWSDVTQILLASAFKQATEAFSDVSDFRSQFKHSLKPCFGEGRKKMPKTPKKLAHKVPSKPQVPEIVRIIDFDMDSSFSSEMPPPLIPAKMKTIEEVPANVEVIESDQVVNENLEACIPSEDQPNENFEENLVPEQSLPLNTTIAPVSNDQTVASISTKVETIEEVVAPVKAEVIESIQTVNESLETCVSSETQPNENLQECAVPEQSLPLNTTITPVSNDQSVASEAPISMKVETVEEVVAPVKAEVIESNQTVNESLETCIPSETQPNENLQESAVPEQSLPLNATITPVSNDQSVASEVPISMKFETIEEVVAPVKAEVIESNQTVNESLETCIPSETQPNENVEENAVPEQSLSLNTTIASEIPSPSISTKVETIEEVVAPVKAEIVESIQTVNESLETCVPSETQPNDNVEESTMAEQSLPLNATIAPVSNAQTFAQSTPINQVKPKKQNSVPKPELLEVPERQELPIAPEKKALSVVLEEQEVSSAVKFEVVEEQEVSSAVKFEVVEEQDVPSAIKFEVVEEQQVPSLNRNNISTCTAIGEQTKIEEVVITEAVQQKHDDTILIDDSVCESTANKTKFNVSTWTSIDEHVTIEEAVLAKSTQQVHDDTIVIDDSVCEEQASMDVPQNSTATREPKTSFKTEVYDASKQNQTTDQEGMFTESTVIQEEVSTFSKTFDKSQSKQNLSAAKTPVTKQLIDKGTNTSFLQPVVICPPKETKVDEVSVYDMTSTKFSESMMENDYDVNDLSSGDETDDELNPRKKVPTWAEKDAMRQTFKKLYRTINRDTVNGYFGVLRPPQIAELFSKTKRKYKDMTIDQTTAWD